MTAPYSIMSKLDFIMTLTNLAETADNCIFLDSSEDNFKASSLTFFHEGSHATLGIVYTAHGGAARIFNNKMKVAAHVIEKLSLEDYHGIKNTMMKIQKDLGSPEGVNLEGLEAIIEELKQDE